MRLQQPIASENLFSVKKQIPVSSLTLSDLLAGKNNALTIAMFIVAFCFALIGGIGWEVSRVLKNQLITSPDSLGNLSTLEVIGYVCVIAPWIMSLFISWKLKTINPFWIVLTILLFTCGNIIGFAFVFLKNDVPSDWLMIFTVAGGVFLVSAILGYFGKWINKIWKYVLAFSIIWGIAFFILLILRFAIPSPIVNDTYLIIVGIFGFLTMFYIMYSVNKLKNFTHVEGQERYSINIILFFAFRLLFNLVQLVWIFARLFLD